ncbi:MAG: DNA sulfur modification protein DndB, partial [Pseudomonadales bacterium]
VVAVYEGEPKWHPFDTISKNSQELVNIDAPDYALECMGYLSLSRNEKIFALDGQHRLAGIQYALLKDPELGCKQLPVTFLPHYNDADGLKRTRRLFTTLNKKAKPVDKAAIISLDEDDVCACATRYLVEESDLFNGSEIKYQANNNVSYSDAEVITTIGSLYDLVKEIFRKIKLIPSMALENFRGSEGEKQELFLLAEDIFRYMFDKIAVLNEFDKAINKEPVVVKYRNKNDGGNFLFRPVGLKIYLMAMAKFVKISDDDINTAYRDFVDSTHSIDFMMASPLLLDKVWDSENKKMIPFKADVRNQIIDDILDHANQMD